MLILHKPALVLFILLTAIYFASTSGGVNSGDGSSYALTKSLGESLTVEIDRFKSFTYDVDFARVKGHYYLDREPGLSFLSLPFYVLAKILSPFAFPPYAGPNPVVDSESILQSLTYLTTAVFGSLAVVFLFYPLSFLVWVRLTGNIPPAISGNRSLLHFFWHPFIC